MGAPLARSCGLALCSLRYPFRPSVIVQGRRRRQRVSGLRVFHLSGCNSLAVARVSVVPMRIVLSCLAGRALHVAMQLRAEVCLWWRCVACRKPPSTSDPQGQKSRKDSARRWMLAHARRRPPLEPPVSRELRGLALGLPSSDALAVGPAGPCPGSTPQRHFASRHSGRVSSKAPLPARLCASPICNTNLRLRALAMARLVAAWLIARAAGVGSDTCADGFEDPMTYMQLHISAPPPTWSQAPARRGASL